MFLDCLNKVGMGGGALLWGNCISVDQRLDIIIHSEVIGQSILVLPV